MGLTYDPGSRKWNLVYEKEIPKPTAITEDFQSYKLQNPEYKRRYDLNFPRMSSVLSVAEWESHYDMRPIVAAIAKNYETEKTNYSTAIKEWEKDVEQTKLKNEAYDKTLAVVNSTSGGDYVKQRDLIRNISGIDDTLKNKLEDYYKDYYSNEKIQQWNSALGAKPPYGKFVPSYYKAQNSVAAQQWQSAVDNDDIDITQRFAFASDDNSDDNKDPAENRFYLYHYTFVGKPAGARGNEEDKLAAAKQYVELKPTDAQLQAARTVQLGINTDTQTERLLKVPEVAAAWEAAKAGDTYWKSKGKEFFLDLNKPDEFAVLFRMSDRPEDKEVAFKYNINAGYGITELEDALNVAVGEKAIVDVKRFGALTQDVLKETIEQMKKAKGMEQELAIFSGFDSFGEITGINKDLTNSILGDSGVGGVLSFMGGDKAQKSLEKSLRGITGINNEVTYNWQQWFDNTLKEKYQDDLELGLTKEQAEERVKVQGQFARDFIDQYLMPRFNESKSMNEFVEYLDVRQSEQNPFQTQDILNAVKLVADLRANEYIEELRKTPERYFNAEFYFNPSGAKANTEKYAKQASTVNIDWETAKNNPNALVDPTRLSLGTWGEQAYRFGIKLNDKEQFARLHFQLIGQLPEDPNDLSKGIKFDPADDILTASKVSDYIYDQILPALNEEALAQGTVFGQFLRPEEFANEMLKGLNPEDKKTWDEVLEKYGLESFGGTIEELKEYITDAVRTGSAQQIREQIKYLNEKKEKPTQEVLGVSYIQREADYKPAKTVEGESELYKVFQSAGFQGTEDEFYENFFPDVDRSEQVALTKAGSNKALKTTGLDLSDPFASLGTIQSFFGEDDTKVEKTPTKSSYFTIDEDEKIPAKSSAGQGFLDEFTSLFKGLK